ASATDPSTWSSFEEALRVFQANHGQLDGLGFVLGWIPDSDRCISGIDLDHCVDSQGRIADWAQALIDSLGSYAEISPSGRGVEVFAEGFWIEGPSYEVLDGLGEDGGGQIEIARSGRYFTVTGNSLDPARSDLARCSKLLMDLHEWIDQEHCKRNGVRDRPGR